MPRAPSFTISKIVNRFKERPFEHACHQRRSRQTHHQPQHLRPLRRASGPLHLRRLLGRREFRHPQHARHPQRCRRSAQEAEYPDSALAGRLLRRRIPLEGRHRAAREARASMVNTHWGGVVENNHFGTHEFFDLCEMLGAEPYICGNVGSRARCRKWRSGSNTSPHRASPRWPNLRRKNGREEPWKLPYFGVGNESWGCGGNMRPEYYADEYRRYQTYVRQLRRQGNLQNRLRRQRRRLRLDRTS